MAEACEPFNDPDFRQLLIDIKKKSEQIIDTVSIDTVIDAGFSEAAKERAKGVVTSFKEFLEKNRDEITALQMIYSKPYKERHLTYESIKELADELTKPPRNLPPEVVWTAYEQLDQAKVKRLGPQRILTDVISLVRYALGEITVLEPYTDRVDERFIAWLDKQEKAGREFTAEQLAWLDDIKNHIATSLSIEIDDFDYAPFQGKGGRMRVHQVFGDELESVLSELSEVLAA